MTIIENILGNNCGNVIFISNDFLSFSQFIYILFISNNQIINDILYSGCWAGDL